MRLKKQKKKNDEIPSLKTRIAVALAGMGFGITVAFFFILLLLPPSAGLVRSFPYFVLGLWAGAFVFSLLKPKLLASGIAYLAGLAATLLAGALVGQLKAGFFMVLAVFSLMAVIPYFSGVEGPIDVFLTPSSYFGGFVTGLIVVADFAGSGVSYIIFSGVLGAVVCFFAVAFRFFARRTRA